MAKAGGLAKSLRFAAPSQPEKLENGLYPIFLSILQNDVQGNMGVCLLPRTVADS